MSLFPALKVCDVFARRRGRNPARQARADIETWLFLQKRSDGISRTTPRWLGHDEHLTPNRLIRRLSALSRSVHVVKHDNKSLTKIKCIAFAECHFLRAPPSWLGKNQFREFC